MVLGKSTLIKTILGLHKKDSGEISINILNEDISYVAQNNMTDISFPATAKEIILTGIQKHKQSLFYSKEDYKKFEEVCELLNIKEISKKRIGSLSGGERQRVILARALIRNPKLIILDEPASGLDANITKELYRILEKLHKESHLTIMMITHDIDEIKDKSARLICLAKTLKYNGNLKDWKGL